MLGLCAAEFIQVNTGQAARNCTAEIIVRAVTDEQEVGDGLRAHVRAAAVDSSASDLLGA
jgi:hypothetical protein